MDFRERSVEEWAAAVRSREVSAREMVEGSLAAIDAHKDLNAFVATDPERSLAEAELIDARLAEGEEVGPLAGIPIGVKDLEDAAGYVTTGGSMLYADDPPAAADSELVARLRSAGCVVMGKTNTPEFGWTGDTYNPLFGPTGNPWNPRRSPGGSSGGSAAALTAGLVPLCTGSDGGGSIRIPAAACGFTGFKSSLGRVPVDGPARLWPISVHGPMALRVADAAFVLDLVMGPSPRDLNSLPRPERSWRDALDEGVAASAGGVVPVARRQALRLGSGGRLRGRGGPAGIRRCGGGGSGRGPVQRSDPGVRAAVGDHGVGRPGRADR